MTIVAQLALVPRDALFCKDGRGWSTSATGRGHALEWPHPNTLRGALRAIWGRAREAELGRCFTSKEWGDETVAIQLGRLIALRRRLLDGSASWQRTWPTPADLLVTETGEAQFLDPEPLAGAWTLGRDDDPARERLWTKRTAKVKPGKRPRWWTDEQLIAWLSLDLRKPEFFVEHTPELPRRFQTHVSIAASTGTAAERLLYSHELVETVDREHEWAIGCEVTLPSRQVLDIATIGSDRRLARVESLEDSRVFECPKALTDAFDTHAPKGLRLVAVTPCAFERGWLPDRLERAGEEYRGRVAGLDVEVILRAAFVERPLGISGWDMAAAEPRPSMRMVPPGSVYMFVRADGQAFTARQAESLWLATIGERTNEGFGRVVPGIWNPVSKS